MTERREYRVTFTRKGGGAAEEMTLFADSRDDAMAFVRRLNSTSIKEIVSAHLADERLQKKGKSRTHEAIVTTVSMKPDESTRIDPPAPWTQEEITDHYKAKWEQDR